MSGWLRLRQIALIAPELEAPVAALKEVFGLAEGFRDDHMEEMFGLHNCLLPIGEQLLEVVATVKPDTQGTRFLERRGAGGYMVILQADPHAAFREKVTAMGVRVIAERATAAYHFIQLHPRDTGGPMLEVDWHEGGDMPENPWSHAAGTDWRKAIRTTRVNAIAAAVIQSDDPAALAAKWSAILDRPVRNAHDGELTIALDGSVLRFVRAKDGRGEGLGGLDLMATDKAAVLKAARARGLPIDGDTITLAGLRFRLV
jgi:hypothetical protein